MTDVFLVATIVAFFLAAALLVNVCSRITASSTDEAGSETQSEGASSASATGAEQGRPR